jgi:hypothetical protein
VMRELLREGAPCMLRLLALFRTMHWHAHARLNRGHAVLHAHEASILFAMLVGTE